MKLRLATIDDIASVSDLCIKSVQAYFPKIGFNPAQIADHIQYVGDPDVALEWINHGDLWMCEKDGNLLGVAGIKTDPWSAYFGFNYVYPAGQGTGSMLIKHCINQASQAHCRWLIAEVIEDNHLGQAHLARHGFKLSESVRTTRARSKMRVQLWGHNLSTPF
jgi:N-acetylglutamate synthase-like GNAT family acetyltransferase